MRQESQTSVTFEHFEVIVTVRADNMELAPHFFEAIQEVILTKGHQLFPPADGRKPCVGCGDGNP